MATPYIELDSSNSKVVVQCVSGGVLTILFADSATDRNITIPASPYVVTSLADLVYALDAMGLVTDNL